MRIDRKMLRISFDVRRFACSVLNIPLKLLIPLLPNSLNSGNKNPSTKHEVRSQAKSMNAGTWLEAVEKVSTFYRFGAAFLLAICADTFTYTLCCVQNFRLSKYRKNYHRSRVCLIVLMSLL